MYYFTFDNTRIELKSLNNIYKIINPHTAAVLSLSNSNLTHIDNNIFKHHTQLKKLN